jgi:hypothetical protein
MRPAGMPPARTSDRRPWLIAGGALAGALVLVLVMVSRGAEPGPGATATATAEVVSGAGGAPPDISRMSPKERFNRLYDRVMRAAQAGDEAAVQRFTPMALSAYEMLDSVDADARYHAALLRAHTGDVERARALGDTILARNPGHLLGYIVLGTSARWRKDEAALAQAYREFLTRYDAEMKVNRPEYAEHRFSIEEFRRAADAARPSRSAGS